MKSASNTSGASPENDGWNIAPLLAPEDYYSQAHPSLVTDSKSIPIENVFSGPLVKYGPGGTNDIYDDEKVPDDWKDLSQVDREKKVHWMATKNTIDYLLKKKGVRTKGQESIINILKGVHSRKGTVLYKAENYDRAKETLDSLLESGIPVVAGISFKNKSKSHRSSGQNHLIIIVGRGEDKRGRFYTHFDTGRSRGGYDTEKNRLYLRQTPDGMPHPFHISGKRGDGKREYYLCEIRQMVKE